MIVSFVSIVMYDNKRSWVTRVHSAAYLSLAIGGALRGSWVTRVHSAGFDIEPARTAASMISDSGG